MYLRIIAMVLAIMLALTAGLTAVSFVSLQSRQIDARLNNLKNEAREIAWLAGQNAPSLLPSAFNGSDVRTVLRWKAASVYDEYGAYILMVDRYGRVMDNLQTAYERNPDFVASLDSQELNAALQQVLSGEEISVRTAIDGSTMFTVGVPYMQNGHVLGATLIQTPTQSVEGIEETTVLQIIGIALGAMVLASACVLLYVRKAMRPLRTLTEASRKMTGGDFTVRVPVNKSVKEIASLSETFNGMTARLGVVEVSRREFVANVSHELRSPITSIRGFVEGMEDGTIPAEEHPKYLGIVADETRRLSRLIESLLALSRLERDDAVLQETDFDIAELMRRCIIRRVNDLERMQMEVVLDVPEDGASVHADSDRIEQVIANLLDNAIKFTPAGGEIRFSAQKQGERWNIAIADSGPGVAPEDRERIFERFYTADHAHTSGKGTGLGLSICQRIIEMHGGVLRLLDTDRGAAFGFSLPSA